MTSIYSQTPLNGQTSFIVATLDSLPVRNVRSFAQDPVLQGPIDELSRHELTVVNWTNADRPTATGGEAMFASRQHPDFQILEQDSGDHFELEARQ